MKYYYLLKNCLSSPELMFLYGRRLFRSLDYFNIDYKFLNGYSFPPKSVCLILSEKCNLHCRMCDIGKTNKSALFTSLIDGPDYLLKNDWFNIIEDLSFFKPKPLVLLTGAEPFLCPDILSIIKRVIEKRLPLQITTNGTLAGQFAAAIVEMCSDTTCLDINFSIDGKEDIHDVIRGKKGTFKKAVSSLLSFDKEKKDAGKRFPLINLTCTVSDVNYNKLEDYVEWLLKENIPFESLTFNHLWFKNIDIIKKHNSLFDKNFPVEEQNIGGIDFAKIDMDMVYNQIKHIRQRCKNHSVRIHQFPDLRMEEMPFYYTDPARFVFYNRCNAAWRNVAITPKGNIILSPLCFLPPIGNIKDMGFREFWNGEELKSLRKRLKQIKTYPACSRCCMLFGSKPAVYKLKNWFF